MQPTGTRMYSSSSITSPGAAGRGHGLRRSTSMDCWMVTELSAVVSRPVFTSTQPLHRHSANASLRG